MLKFVFLMVLATAVHAQIPTKCESPKQWAAKRVAIDPDQKFERRESYLYDEVNLRKRRLEEVILEDERDYYDIFEFHSQNTEYRVNLRTRNCTKGTLTRPFHVYQIGVNDTYGGEFTVGTTLGAQTGVLIQAWEGQTEEGHSQVSTWTVEGCLPVTRLFNHPTMGYYKENFFDIIIGIPDPNEFIPPKECNIAN